MFSRSTMKEALIFKNDPAAEVKALPSTNQKLSIFSSLFGSSKAVVKSMPETGVVLGLCEINKVILIEYLNANKDYVNTNAAIDQKIKNIKKFLCEAPDKWVSLGAIEAIIAAGAATCSSTSLYTPPVFDSFDAQGLGTSLNSEEVLDGIFTVL